MRYSPETIKKFIGKAADMINRFHNTENLTVCISKGNRKIGHTMNVSLLPVFTCANCSGCREYCYDIKACMQYPKNVLSARARNTVLMRENRKEYFRQIRKALDGRRKNLFFRWHVAGDIPDMDYLSEMVKIAKKYPRFTFWTYTKNYSTVNEYVKLSGGNRFKAIPKNLSIMFSEWKGMTMDNPYGFPEFTCIFPDEKPAAGSYHCSGNCNTCIANGCGCVVGMSSWTYLH